MKTLSLILGTLGVLSTLHPSMAFVAQATTEDPNFEIHSWSAPEQDRTRDAEEKSRDELSPNDLRAEQELLKVTSDMDDKVASLSIILDEKTGGIQKVKYLTGMDETLQYTLEELAAGVTLLKDNGTGIVVVSMKTLNFSAETGGKVEMTYLENGIKKRYKTYALELRLENSHFQIYDIQKREPSPISQMHMKKNTFFGRVIGIAAIETR